MKKNPITAPLISIKLSILIPAIKIPKQVPMTPAENTISDTFNIDPCLDYLNPKRLKKRFLNSQDILTCKLAETQEKPNINEPNI